MNYFYMEQIFMPGYKVHLSFSTVLGAACYYLFTLSTGIIGFAEVSEFMGAFQNKITLFFVVLFFGLWPDVDTTSVGRGIFYSLSFGTDIILIAMGHYKIAAFLGMFCMIPILSEHRGWTHSYLFCFIVPSPFIIIPSYIEGSFSVIGALYYVAAFIGYMSHLILDKKFHYFRKRKRYAK